MLRELGFDVDYIIIGLCGITVILLITVIILIISQIKLRKRYKKFMGDGTGKSLDEKFSKKFDDLNKVIEDNKVIKVLFKKMNEKHNITYQKMGLIKYDAFEETSGKLSFTLALLNEKNDGVILNSVYSIRNGCYVYAKEIINGESYIVLTSEEKLALKEALEGAL